MRPAGFLSERQRRFAWLGFLLAAFQAPLAAKLIDDASWLFAVVVSLLVATVILILHFWKSVLVGGLLALAVFLILQRIQELRA